MFVCVFKHDNNATVNNMFLTFDVKKVYCSYLVSMYFGQNPLENINVDHLVTLILWPLITLLGT